MIEPPPRTLRLRVDDAALASNWTALDRLSGSAAAGAAVKADAYGLGIDRVVPVLHRAGCENYFVAHWSEVAALLRHAAPQHVSVLHGPLSAEDAAYAKATGVRPVINSLHQAQVWNEAGGGACDLMIDTGINRLGLSAHEVGDPLIAALEIDTLLSHLASADEDSAKNAAQQSLFAELSRHVSHRRKSLANSAGIALGPRFAFDLTRPGLSLYGGVPRRELADEVRQVAYLEAAVLQVRDIEAGQSVGYNATWTAARDARVATVSLGYADGFLRSLGKGAALMRGDAKLPLLGIVSMDMVVVDCAAAPDLREGDWLDVPFALPDLARRSGLSQYELLTTLGDRHAAA